jgi:5'-3' exonuclease
VSGAQPAQPLVHLLDGHVYIFRAWATLPSMRAPDGSETGAAYGYTASLLRYLAEQRPEHVAVCLDHAQTSFRNDIEPTYKAQRGDPPPELEAQFALCEELTLALGVALRKAKEYEADDVIATLARRLMAQGARVRVVTSDKDLAQLVGEDGAVSLYDLVARREIAADGVRAKFGVDPAQIPDFLGLVGDAVDNLPGVPGVGPRSAAAILRVFGRVEDVPADPSAWSGVEVRGASRLARLVAEHRERALRTKRLATLVCDVPGVGAGLADLGWRGADRAAVETLFDRLGWGRIRDRVPRWAR